MSRWSLEVRADMAACQTIFGLWVPFLGSFPPKSCHTSCHTPAPFGRYDNSMAGGCLVCIPYYSARSQYVKVGLMLICDDLLHYQTI